MSEYADLQFDDSEFHGEKLLQEWMLQEYSQKADKSLAKKVFIFPPLNMGKNTNTWKYGKP